MTTSRIDNLLRRQKIRLALDVALISSMAALVALFFIAI